MDDSKINSVEYNHTPLKIEWQYTFCANRKPLRVVPNQCYQEVPVVIDGIPSNLIPDGVQLVMRPVFAVDKDTGDVLVDDVSNDRMLVKQVYSRRVSPNIPSPDSFDDNGLPIYTAEQREEIIRMVIAEITDGSLKYLYSVSVQEIRVPELDPDYVRRSIKVRYAS